MSAGDELEAWRRRAEREQRARQEAESSRRRAAVSSCTRTSGSRSSPPSSGAGLHDLRGGGAGPRPRPGLGQRSRHRSEAGSFARTGRPCSRRAGPRGARGLQPVRAGRVDDARPKPRAGPRPSSVGPSTRASIAGPVGGPSRWRCPQPLLPSRNALRHRRGATSGIACSSSRRSRPRARRGQPTPRRAGSWPTSATIRTPLAAIVTDLMGRRTMDPDERVERTRRVQQRRRT